MTNEVKLAFAHPGARAEATAGPEPLDRISLRNHVVEVEIGAFQKERGVTQRVRFDIAVEVRQMAEAAEDDVDRILSYDKVTEAIAAELAAERVNLLETLAERIAARILLEPQAMRVFVRIEKLDRGPGELGVEIVRARTHQTPGQENDPGLRPRILFLGNAAIASDHLTGWLDRLEAAAEPAILCVGRPDLDRPVTNHVWTQRRIDLLAIEQNAWTLAARDDRCVVVSTRTELDWAMKNGQISVWAPSKIVLDAVDGPPATLPDALSLAVWFAGSYGVRDILAIGADAFAPFPAEVTAQPVVAELP
ncbi:dihydroneopterin aldolase [Chachezhania antarctica]|uniref:dihydroneopterin aldolase n=1 Tax=Chachezhania antarctica TaxID=2340860 RepID=UPI000EB47895|nr:dihydroneopterin aldolase [Chachezhania antarctica]|tara:strand:+ start:2456 stop:3376 length:921 start_codon:yes stop_codon:yes gene_type:complete